MSQPRITVCAFVQRKWKRHIAWNHECLGWPARDDWATKQVTNEHLHKPSLKNDKCCYEMKSCFCTLGWVFAPHFFIQVWGRETETVNNDKFLINTCLSQAETQLIFLKNVLYNFSKKCVTSLTYVPIGKLLHIQPSWHYSICYPNFDIIPTDVATFWTGMSPDEKNDTHWLHRYIT